jgi:transposase
MQVKKTVKHRRKYDAEFKEEVIKMAINGRPVREIAESLGISEALIYKWKSRHSGSSVASWPSGSLPLSGDVSAAEHERLKARLREVEQERDILKKALGIFSRGN